MQDETLHKRFQCPVTKTHRDVERCKTCVENVGGARGWRCGLQTNRHGRIISSESVHEDLEKRKKAEEAFEKSRTQPTPVDNMRLPELFETVRSVLNTLKPREREVLSYRFGLVDGKPKTLEEIGKQFNVTRERVRQIEVKALRKLRHPARLKKLAEAR